LFVLLIVPFEIRTVEHGDWSIHANTDLLDDGVDRYLGMDLPAEAGSHV
jgi:hypothetical protein